MILLFGSRTNRRTMGRLMHGCPHCQTQGGFTYVRYSDWFTFFFIPCIPLGSRTRAVCEACGFQQVVQNAWADQALRAAAQMPGHPPYRQ
jgi:hypothetical protein